MDRKFLNRIILLLLMLFAVSAERAWACSCVRSGTVDKEFDRAANVVVLKARAVQRTETEPARLVNYAGIKMTTLTVEKVYKGNLKLGQELVFAQGGGGDCIWTFTEDSIGKEFLFYLGGGPLDTKASENVIAATGQFPMSVNKGVWIASTCSRSGSVDYRAADLKFLDRRAAMRGRTRLSGALTQYISAATKDEASEYRLLSDRKVRVTGGGKTFELKTDKDGVYEIYDLPPGNYKLTPEPVDGYRLSWLKSETETVEIKPGMHTELDFNYRINNAIRGKFYDSAGRPLKDVCLKLLPARGEKADYFFQSDCTEKDGSFEFDEIPAGTYYLVVNEEGKITADEPFGTFFYPNALKREDASVITIGPGEFRENLIVTAPKTEEVIEVSGILLFSDGKPAVSESIEFYRGIEWDPPRSENVEPDSRASTDKNGRFRLRILKDQQGQLLGSMMTFKGEYLSCPKLDDLVRAKAPRTLVEIETKPIKIDATGDIADIELRFPFPSCKKRNIE